MKKNEKLSPRFVFSIIYFFQLNDFFPFMLCRKLEVWPLAKGKAKKC